MKIKLLATGFVMILGLGFLFTPGMAQAEVNGVISIEEAATMIEFYDENGDRFYPYTEEELIAFQKETHSNESLSDIVTPASLRTYSFGYTSFISSVRLNQGASFYSPRSIVLNKNNINDPANPITVRLLSDSTVTHSVNVPGGWVGGLNVPLSSGGIGNRVVELRGSAFFDSGTLYYESR